MSDFLDRIEKLTPKRLALLALEQHEQIEAADRRAHEPLAVVGMACRFPGADDPAAFWELLAKGRDAIGEVPADRWDIDAYFDPDPDAPGHMSVRAGGFLAKVDEFDAAFFGIAPREALTMDPQQRLLLEVAWQALENAGIAPERLAGTATGVFVGICNSDHFHRLLQRGPEAIDAYLASGNAHSVAAGRISYCLGLQGPAMAIDTACSSSLVALHAATRSLRSGESRVALVGGVNLMCTPETTIALTKGHMLAPDGRCKTFDDSADGFSRGEGCGVLVLKRLEDAQADGDHVLALIRGSAINQDGRSGGLTVPNGPAQEAVIRAALADGGVAAAEIDYVEAHGTGTSLGDPIEVRALAGALGAARTMTDPLLIGSVKTNIGHLESAAGVAGMIKVILSLRHEAIPPHLHFTKPSTHIAWSKYPVKVTAAGQPWPRTARRRLAGVSSFGFSGTNAHVVLEEAPPVAADGGAPGALRPLHCMPLSARSEEALEQVAARTRDTLVGATAFADAAYSAGVGRSHFHVRAAVVAADTGEARAALQALSCGESHAALFRGATEPGQVPEVVFLFTGQGSQYPGMSQKLYDSAPVFREVIDRCDELLGADAQGRTLKMVLQAGPAEGAPIHETAWTQPALFAVEYALTRLWASWGIVPAAVIGHSVGEYVAACVAGVFSLEEGLKLIAERGRLLQSLPPGGAMAALFTSPEEVERAIAPFADRLAIAAVNAVDSVVISGDAAAVDAVLAEFAARDIQAQRLLVSFAAHSPLVAPALDAMEACARSVAMRAPRIPVAWNVTGGAALPGAAPDAHYWRRHLREPVRFAAGVESLYRDGYRVFLEVGPHPTLVALAQHSLPEAGPLLLTSLRRGKDDWLEMLTSLARLYVNGAAVDWSGFDAAHGRRRIDLPTYPFERQSYWITPDAPRQRAAGRATGSTLLGNRLPTALAMFETILAPTTLDYLGDHRVHGAVLVAGPVFLELAQAAARQVAGPGMRGVEVFAIREPLVLPDAGRIVQTHVGDELDGVRAFSIYSRDVDGSGEWRLHATGRLVATDARAAVAGADITGLSATQDALGAAQSCDPYYERLAGLGIALGPAFRSLVLAHRTDGEVLAQIALPMAAATDALAWAHPALLDGALQAVGLALPPAEDDATAYLLTEVDRLDLAGPLPARLWCHARVRNARDQNPAEWQADVTLRSLEGGVLGVIEGVRLHRATRDALARAAGQGGSGDMFYRVEWEPAPLVPRAAAALAAPEGFMAGMRDRFASLAARYGLAIYEQLLPELDRLSGDHVAAALRTLGFDSTCGRVFTVPEEAARLGVVACHARLFKRLLDMLVEDGVLRVRGAGLEVIGPLPSADAADRYETLLARHAQTQGELRTLRRCGPELARVLRGEQDPLQLLFPGGSFDEARELYVESPFAQTYNRALGEALQAALATVPPGARLRVLEIGAGTGGTTTYVLPLLPADRTEYTFTDLSPLFLERAAEQFAAYPFVRHALLDIEADPVGQGFAAGAYDIVIAANVLHATADLRQSLVHAQRLMAPGAMLFLLEGVAPERWVDLTFGLTEGWWRFADTDLRPHYPLIDRGAWLNLLQSVGFNESAALPDATWTARGAAQQSLVVARAPLGGRHWVVVGADGGVGTALAELLRARGDIAMLLPVDASDGAVPPEADLVYLGALELAARPMADASAVRVAQHLACDTPLRWLKAMARGSGRAWLATQGVQAGVGAVVPGAPWQAPLWGLGRGFALEHPDRWGGLIDLQEGDAAAVAATLLAALDGADQEDQTTWRGGRRSAPRLVHAPAPRPAQIDLAGDGTYLVTGGFGGLGLLVARWLVDRGARHIALLGRHPDPTSDGVRALEALGAKVLSLQGDVGDAPAMEQLFARLRVEAPPLRGVIHAAAALSAAPLVDLTSAQVAEMMRPKLDGSLVLERLTRDPPIDFLVLFSSTTALLGASGLAHYAAANAFLDALAAAADGAKRRVISINWGTWEVMRLASAESQRSYLAGGLLPMSASDALDALGRLLADPRPQAVVAKVDWGVLKALHEARRPRPLLTHLGKVQQAARRVARTVAGPGLAERLAAVPPSQRHDLLVDFVQREVADVLGLAGASAVPLTTGLFDLGMDSLMSVELKRRLERGAERPMPSTLTFNYPNVAALARFLETQLAVRIAEPAGSAAPVASAAATSVVPEADVDLDALSDDELEARLMARLEQMR
ncbi:MAG: SDR family NAD(P)-dependent oxidoreductase [Rhodocyclales bacterium]|nr:SDR family NAD(P)-dependent oxidoreductase [Rhodocyclales bacterium]